MWCGVVWCGVASRLEGIHSINRSIDRFMLSSDQLSTHPSISID